MRVSMCSLAAAVAMAVSPAWADDNNDRITQLEQELAVVKASQNDSPLKNFQINGFATFGVTKASNELGYVGIDSDELGFSQDSMAAIQTSFNINDKAQAVVQLVARYEEQWDPAFEWAYVAYNFDNGATARAGRLRAPVFMLSDYLEVGYAYPYARPSEEVYGSLPLTTLDGLDLRYPVQLGSVQVVLQPFMGEAKVNEAQAINIRNILGLAVETSWDNFTVRTSYADSELHSSNGAFNGESGTFLGLGGSWDNGQWQLLSEWTQIEVDGATPDTESFYVALAYRYQELTPYAMFGVLKTTDNDLRAPLQLATGYRSAEDIKRSAYSLGLRWDFAQAMAMKLDVTYAGDFGDTSGGLPGNYTDFNSYNVVNPATVNDDAVVTSLLFDVVF